MDETGSDLSEGELLPGKPKGTVVRVTDKDRAVLELKGARDQVKRSKRKVILSLLGNLLLPCFVVQLDMKIGQDRAKELIKG